MGTNRSLRLAAVAGVLLLAWLPLGAWQGGALPANTTHQAVQLTTQQPTAPAPGVPDRAYPVDAYDLGSDIWIAIPPVVGGADVTGSTVRLYVLPHRQSLAGLCAGTGLEDCSGGYETWVLQPETAGDNRVLVWSGASVQGRYDVVVDFEPFGVYTPGVDLVDHSRIGGFQVLDGSRAIDYIIITPDPGCARIIGTQSYVGGLYEPTEEFVANGWDNGPNNINEDGGGDDVFQGTVSALWTTTVGANVGRIDSSTGLYVALNVTGEGDVQANYLGRTDTVYVMTTTPTWVP